MSDDLLKRIARIERERTSSVKLRRKQSPRTMPARILVPALMKDWAYPIELYAFRHKMRQEGAYDQADGTSQIINVAGLKRRAQLEKQGKLRPWTKRARHD
jgi:hypothetical protein